MGNDHLYQHIQSICQYSCGSSRYFLHQIVAFWEIVAKTKQSPELGVEVTGSILGPERDCSREMDKTPGDSLWEAEVPGLMACYCLFQVSRGLSASSMDLSSSS